MEYREEQIYHYTTFAGFYGILSSKELWASNIHYLNDSLEFRHAIDICKHQINNQYVSDEFKKELATRLESIAQINICVASFSKEADLLSQWRAYCKTNGVAIGFSRNELEQIGAMQGYRLWECVYDESDKIKKISELLKGAEETNLPTYGLEKAIEIFLNRFFMMGASFKHLSFKEESEYRLISEPKSCLDEKFCHRPVSTMLIPYHKVNLGIKSKIDDKDRQNIGIKRLVIGPNPNGQLAINSVTNCLNNKHILWEQVQHSSTPYRQLV